MAVRFNEKYGYAIEFSDKVKAELEAFVSEHEEEWYKLREQVKVFFPQIGRIYTDIAVLDDKFNAYCTNFSARSVVESLEKPLVRFLKDKISEVK